MKRKLFRAIGIVLIAAAAALAAYNEWDDRRAGRAAEEVLEQLDAAMAEQERPEGAAPVGVSGEEAPAEAEMPALTVDAGECVGVLTIPKLNRSLPVMREWNYSLLKNSPCRYSGSVYTGDMVIAGHNYRSHFGGGFGGLKAGDEIYFTDVYGGRFKYRISRTETLKPTAIEEMTSGDWDLTLFTCTLGGEARFAVRCALM